MTELTKVQLINPLLFLYLLFCVINYCINNIHTIIVMIQILFYIFTKINNNKLINCNICIKVYPLEHRDNSFQWLITLIYILLILIILKYKLQNKLKSVLLRKGIASSTVLFWLLNKIIFNLNYQPMGFTGAFGFAIKVPSSMTTSLTFLEETDLGVG